MQYKCQNRLLEIDSRDSQKEYNFDQLNIVTFGNSKLQKQLVSSQLNGRFLRCTVRWMTLPCSAILYELSSFHYLAFEHLKIEWSSVCLAKLFMKNAWSAFFFTYITSNKRVSFLITCINHNL